MEIVNRYLEDNGLAPLPSVVSEAMAYVPFQPNGAKNYHPVQGFESGTMFPSLNKPFYGSKCSGDCHD